MWKRGETRRRKRAKQVRRRGEWRDEEEEQKRQ
jgi:hypothetical protein